MKEKILLLEVEKGGEELVLLDGRRLMVNPGDIPTACIWLPTANLEILETKDSVMFSVSILNIETEEYIKAMWL